MEPRIFGICSASMPNGLAPPPMRSPEDFTSKPGFTRSATRGLIPSRVPSAATALSSFSDSTLKRTPAEMAWETSSSRLPGPAKLTFSTGMGVSRATFISPADATSKPSTRCDRCCTTAGIGFALIA